MTLKSYFFNVMEVLSQAANAIVFAGNPNMTVSARCYLNRTRGGWRYLYRLVNMLFFWQEDHCRGAYLNDILFARLVLFELEPLKHPYTEPHRPESI